MFHTKLEEEVAKLGLTFDRRVAELVELTHLPFADMHED